MKRILIGAFAALCILGGVYALQSRSVPADEGLVKGPILMSTFTSAGERTGKALFQVPFLKTLEESTLVSIALDSDENGTFEDHEFVVRDYPVRPHADWRSGFYAAFESDLENPAGLVVVDGAEYPAVVESKQVEVGDLLDLSSVTDPENATKGWGAEPALASGHISEVLFDDVPDLTQRKAECAPTAAANSLIALVDRHGGEDLIPGDPQDFIENLKRHMNWTPENGVPPDDFVAGKNRWAAAAGVPIRTEKIGNYHGTSTVAAIREALRSGAAVELRIRFSDGEKIIGGHMVTVTGIQEYDEKTFLAINDPATPDSGTEVVEVRSNQLVNYGPFKGLTLLTYGFAQVWEGHPTGELFDTMTDEEIQGIRQFVGETPMISVIEYNGKYLPTSQLTVQDEIGCGADHWHAARGGAVTATDGTVVPDPGPQCGYGKVRDLPSMNIPAPQRND